MQAQQAAGLSAPYPLDKTRQLVETAMLAAVTALAYTVGSLLRVEAYMAYVLPLPVVLAALRSGPGPAVKTLTAAVLLLLSECDCCWWHQSRLAGRSAGKSARVGRRSGRRTGG